MANALGQSADHVTSFFKMVRFELAFYLGCLNLRRRLLQLGEPLCWPKPLPSGTLALRSRELYDVGLALRTGARVVVTGANTGGKSTFLRSVAIVGVMSFFADLTYEGSRGIVGPYLGLLGASAFTIAVVSGFGELAGYGLRLVSGRFADVTGRYWPITIAGYVVQMAAVPALALAGSWPAAAALVVLERVGKAVRNPPRDAMLSHAGKDAGGYG